MRYIHKAASPWRLLIGLVHAKHNHAASGICKSRQFLK